LEFGRVVGGKAVPECIGRPFADTGAALGGFPELSRIRRLDATARTRQRREQVPLNLHKAAAGDLGTLEESAGTVGASSNGRFLPRDRQHTVSTNKKQLRRFSVVRLNLLFFWCERGGSNSHGLSAARS
jgi:hypothetical protein